MGAAGKQRLGKVCTIVGLLQNFEGFMSKPTLVASQEMPDIARRSLGQAQDTLDWVGMSHVHQPLMVKDGDVSKASQAKVQVYVNLADFICRACICF